MAGFKSLHTAKPPGRNWEQNFRVSAAGFAAQ